MSAWINYHHLLYFKTIAEEGGVSRAAAKLRLGQPTLSAQLRQFEESLGVELFHRSHKKLVLTEHGRVALEYARSIFQMGSEMYEALHDRLQPHRPSLCIGALDSVAKQIVVQLVKSAQRISPCQVTLLEGRSEELLRELSAHRIDMMITDSRPSSSTAKNSFHRVVAKNQVSFYATPKFKPLRKNFPHSISGQPLILSTFDSRIRSDVDQWAKTHSIELNVVVEGQDIAVKKLMAVDGMGLIAAPAHAVNRQILGGELIEIGALDGVYEELVLTTADRKIANPIAQKLMRQFNV